MFPSTLETDRLRLERLSLETVDLHALHELWSPAVDDVPERTRYLPWSPHDHLQETREYVERMEGAWREGSRAQYVIRPRAGEDGAGEIAGEAGLICEWEKDLALPAIWLRRQFWGRGYSGERADALLELAFERLGVGVVAVPLHADNERSYRAVEKYVERHGGRYEGLLRNHAGRYDEPTDHHRFSISRQEYLAANGETARSD